MEEGSLGVNSVGTGGNRRQKKRYGGKPRNRVNSVCDRRKTGWEVEGVRERKKRGGWEEEGGAPAIKTLFCSFLQPLAAAGYGIVNLAK